MADYAITQVRYSSDRSRIQRLRVQALRSGAKGPPFEVWRHHVVIALQQGRTFVTPGEVHVRLVEHGDWHYLRVQPGQNPGDDLPGVVEY
jgi:hypothetical protein